MAKIFYFSATGNSYRIAKRLCQKIPDCEVTRITHKTTPRFIDDEVVGIVFPVYYFGLPEMVAAFLERIQITNTSYLFVIATRGVLGAGGVKNQVSKKIQGKVSYFQYVTMGDSFNLDFWNSSSEKVKDLRNRQSDIAVDKIAQSIQNREIRKKYALVDYLGFITDRFPRYGYKTYENKVYNSDNCFQVDMKICTSCRKCIKSCPVNNLQFDSKPQWKRQNCQLCLACFHCCPVNAIQYTNGALSTIGKSQYWNY